MISETDKPVENGPVFLYSLLLPTTWSTCSAVVSAVLPDFRFSIASTILFLLVFAIATVWIFYRFHNRLPANSETWRLIAYCSVFAGLIETWTIWAPGDWPDLFSIAISRGGTARTALTAAVFDSILIAVALRYSAEQYLKKYLIGKGSRGP